MFSFGLAGAPEDVQKAIEHYLMAANQGHSDAQNSLGTNSITPPPPNHHHYHCCIFIIPSSSLTINTLNRIYV